MAAVSEPRVARGLKGGLMDALLMISTAGSAKEARKIARNLVEGRLAACVNVIPGVASFFRWKGRLCQEKEALILVKTVNTRVKKIIDKIKEIHSYEVPEIIFFRAVKGEKKYLKWVERMVK
jgi:periplasmic divalent cation tolerance protein